MTRQAKSVSKIRADRRRNGRCAECGARSKTFRCDKCRPHKSPREISSVRRAAQRASVASRLAK